MKPHSKVVYLDEITIQVIETVRKPEQSFSSALREIVREFAKQQQKKGNTNEQHRSTN
jgi:predicted DNA-binding ribbon-helix-helix protein